MTTWKSAGPEHEITLDDARTLLHQLLDSRTMPQRVLLIPPDITRLDSWSGPLTCLLYEMLHPYAKVMVLPALGTHRPMTKPERELMFPGLPDDVFLVHDWRNGVENIGTIPASYVRDLSAGKMDEDIPVYLSKHVLEPWDLILSIGQLVPHEVIGIANYNKNIFIGVGGNQLIHRSHYLGALHGMEKTMGRPESPVRDLLNYAHKHFASHLPIFFLLTVRDTNPSGQLVTRGLYLGDDEECFLEGSALSQQLNITQLDEPLDNVVVYLKPEEFKSTWLGNKAVYRTRMAMADHGKLTVIAPAVMEFGEDPTIDKLIRRHGYRGTPQTLAAVESDPEMAQNLSAAAHLMHGCSEGRFTITYCPGHLTKEETEGVGYEYADVQEMMAYYNIPNIPNGWNTDRDGNKFYYISNPAQGLWGLKKDFANDDA